MNDFFVDEAKVFFNELEEGKSVLLDDRGFADWVIFNKEGCFLANEVFSFLED